MTGSRDNYREPAQRENVIGTLRQLSTSNPVLAERM